MTHVRRLRPLSGVAWSLGVAALLGVACSTAESEPLRGAGESVAVATFNIHHGEGTDGIVDLDRTADAIRDSGADVVGLQEVDRHFDQRSGFRDQLATLLESLSDASAAGEGDANTHPSDEPRRRTDFVLASPDLTALDARVVDADASDHRPVAARLATTAPIS